MRTRWQTNKGSVYNVAYHIIWCPKYRRAILVDDVAERLKTLLYEQASKFGWIIESMEVMPDHVHLFIKANPIDPIARIVAQLKGYTSHVLRAEFIHLKSKLPTLWTRAYYVETIGHISEDVIKRYIEEQKNK
jgi:putative transposase